VNFSVNISMLYTELPFLERFDAVCRSGFSAVEFWWPEGIDLGSLRDAITDSGLDVALINFDGGDLAAGQRGLIAEPRYQERFRENVPIALQLACDVGCGSLNALVGLWSDDLEPTEQLELAHNNLRWAADAAAELDRNVLIEAINSVDVPRYLCTTSQAAMEFIAAVDRPNVLFQYDCYHLAMGRAALAEALADAGERIGHVQLADAPGRHEPGTGGIDFAALLSALETRGYSGFVGLEYVPLGGTDDSLAWLPPAQRSGDFDAEIVTTAIRGVREP
jgi:hydroxypyruvate isomerase